MKWFLLLTMLTAVYGKPQYLPENNDSEVEIEKQDLIEIHPNSKQLFDTKTGQRKIEENTREILEKIAEVNKKQGLTKKQSRPSYFHFPFSYSKSQQEDSSNSRKSNEFKFPNNPFSNPIFEYIENEKIKDPNNYTPMQYSVQIVNDKLASPMDQTNVDGISKDDIIPGQFIKRKITHHQTFLVPGFMPNQVQNQMFLPVSPNIPHQTLQYPIYNGNYGTTIPENIPENQEEIIKKTLKKNNNNNLNNLEKQTIDNVKNIVINSQLFQPQTLPTIINPYNQNPQYQIINGYPLPEQAPQPVNMYSLLSNPYERPLSRQWQSPLAQYFPIVIKDPIVQMFNAITSMVEYGPGGGGASGTAASPCRKEKSELETRAGKTLNSSNIKYKIENNNENPVLSIYDYDGDKIIETNQQKDMVLDIENLQISNNPDNPLKFDYSFKEMKRNEKSRNTVKATPGPTKKLFEISQEQIRSSTPRSEFIQLRQSPPNRDQNLHADELDDDEDFDRAEDLRLTNDNNKKIFSKDNTGSGIFIHKLKVKKGGVAIAGPGGIATAGSGGTAIVGPNGYAYTQPDSLAIAGSGSKVIAVEPSVNLSEIIKSGNKTTLSGSMSRVGKLVAVGPVIYYNRG